MPNYNRSAYYLDLPGIRQTLRDEIAIRGVSYSEIQEQTGVLAVGIGRFLDPAKNLTLNTDSLITLIKWAGGNVDRFVKRRRTVARHTDTFEQRKLRTGQAYLRSLGVEPEIGETSVDVLMRLVNTAKENGFLK